MQVVFEFDITNCFALIFHLISFKVVGSAVKLLWYFSGACSRY